MVSGETRGDVLPVSPRRHLGLVEAVERTSVRGWAADLSMPGLPALLILVMDGQPLAAFRTTDPRMDVNAAGVPGEAIGFNLELPATVLDGKGHRLSIRFRNGPALDLLDGTGDETREFDFRFNPYATTGMIDGMFGSSVRGWIFCTDLRTGHRSGKVDVEVRANGVRIDQVKAASNRLDVAEAHGCDGQCGFLYPVPTRFRNGRPFMLEFVAVPDGRPLEGSPYSGQTMVRGTADQLQVVLARVEALCTEVYALKDQLRTMTTTDEYGLDAYHAWATAYFNTLDARVVAARRDPRYGQLLGGAGPKVSVLCPTYRPDLDHFAAAVDSVRRQTWTNWEFIIVDDGSGSSQLTAAIDAYCASDQRIRSVPQHKNGGISAATNAAIAAATGDYLALFDHDDLLLEVALEVMLLAARSSGAAMVFSDEDKIDSAGILSEPHFKPDWNYRLLLTNNYVCHLLMVDAATLRAVGPLNSAYDGAQDHDLVLRLGEALDPSRIHHVPEVLYHWRKTPNSTASQQSSKSYATDAGRAAVRDHLLRRGISADVSAPYGKTLFDVRWPFDAEPKVTILIPFKDQVRVTRRCIDALQRFTHYGNLAIVLIDNWSAEPETLEWLGEVIQDKRISVVRIEETFNFSRINNLVARRIETDFLLFLNNDVFVTQADWLRLMVNEALADPAVAIVGCKLAYPNGLVQHAGVVLGVGGVGDHTFRYAAPDAPGYSHRASVAQEWSAVTAACMLCRADVFRQVEMFDEQKLRVAFNDVDLCLKVRRAGYKVVYTAAVTAEHHESLSRGSDLAAHNLERFYGENQTMMDRWGPAICRDPFYNQNFSSEDGMFSTLSNRPLNIERAASLFAEPPTARPNPALSVPPQPIQTTSPAGAQERPARTRAVRRSISAA